MGFSCGFCVAAATARTRTASDIAENLVFFIGQIVPWSCPARRFSQEEWDQGQVKITLFMEGVGR
jgi:hypothetical protein